MRSPALFACLAAAVMTLVLAHRASAQAPAQPPTAAGPSAKELVQKLGSNDFKQRDQAQKDLVKMGAAAVDDVTAGLTSKDGEVSSRCEAILKELQAAGVQMRSIDVDKQLLWSLKMNMAPAGGVTVAKGVLYVVSPEGKLLAVDVKTGQEKWHMDGPFDFLAPPMSGDLLYACLKTGHIAAFDTTSPQPNKEVWRTKQAFGIPVVADGIVYAANQESGLVAMDAKTGATKWQTLVSRIVGTMVVQGGAIYVIGADQKVYALDIANGKSLWEAKDFSSVVMTLAVSGDIVLALDFKALHGLSVKDGGEKWSVSVEGKVQRFQQGFSNVDIQPADPTPQDATRNFYIGQTQRPLCVADNTVYLWTETQLAAINATTGEESWKFDTLADPAKKRKLIKLGIHFMVGGKKPGEVDYSASMSNGMRPVAYADGIAYVGTNEGLVAINTKTRLKEWSLITNPPAGRPTIVDGVLYFGLTPNPVAPTAATLPADKLSVAGLHALKLKP